MKKIEYPKFTREQNKSCRLSDKDILEIRKLYRFGYPVTRLVEKFRVTKCTIRRWILTPRRRKKKDRENYLKYGKSKRSKLEVNETMAKVRERKKELYLEEIIKYNRQRMSEWKKFNYQRYLKIKMEYYYRNRKRINKKRKLIYQIK